MPAMMKATLFARPRPSSRDMYWSGLRIPLDAFAVSLGDDGIVTMRCPGGQERMRRLVSVIEGGRADLEPSVTHRFGLARIEAADRPFAHLRHGVPELAIRP